MAAMTNDTATEGPVMSPATRAVIEKIPAPINTEMPKTVRSRGPSSRRSLVSGSSVSAIDCSTDLVRNIPDPMLVVMGRALPLAASSGRGRATAPRVTAAPYARRGRREHTDDRFRDGVFNAVGPVGRLGAPRPRCSAGPGVRRGIQGVVDRRRVGAVEVWLEVD